LLSSASLSNDHSVELAFLQRMQKDPARLPPLDRLAAFEAAARHLSFTRAATERFLTQSAISRQIKALEDDLGVALFRRRHRALDLTDDGRRLFAAVQSALREIRAVATELRAPRRRDVLALTTTAGIASLWLIPRLSGFVNRHPTIDVRIDASPERRDLAAEGFDLAIRYTRLEGATGTRLFPETIVPVCAPALVRDRRRRLKTPADLRQHTLLEALLPVGTDMPLEWDTWLRAVGQDRLAAAARLSFSNYDTMVAAAVAGQGVALGRRPLVDQLLSRGKLVAPFKDEFASERGYFIVTPLKARERPAVQALQAWLLEQAAG
jgi:DNA-binding transcriptional LysR family regulator